MNFYTYEYLVPHTAQYRYSCYVYTTCMYEYYIYVDRYIVLWSNYSIIVLYLYEHTYAMQCNAMQARVPAVVREEKREEAGSSKPKKPFELLIQVINISMIHLLTHRV